MSTHFMSNDAILAGVVSAIVAVVLIAFNTVVTYKVWRSSQYTTSQKWAQSALAWLLPLVGLLLVWTVLREEPSNRSIKSSEKVEDRELAGLYDSANPFGPATHDFDVGQH